ncbi:MAG: hypothetical protein QOH56_198 [Pseudonocardiales bacterium]|jgi:uncharacterized protein (DUF952 family)|nr:hypothetical protein [Frankiales bacterium]MDQ1733947.1 hypothetical protein [Pseudonocardiales bacterium]
MAQIFHLVGAAEWRAACEVGRYAPESLASDGFVHFSYRHQVAGTANNLYGDRQDLIVIEVDPALLGEPVVDEDLYGMGEVFPHVYGAIPTSAAVAEHSLSRTAGGELTFG